MNVLESETLISNEAEILSLLNGEQVTKQTRFFERLPIFLEKPSLKFNLSLVEGFLFLPQSQAMLTVIFQRTEMKEDTCLAFITVAWTLSNSLNDRFVSNRILWEIVMISMIKC